MSTISSINKYGSGAFTFGGRDMVTKNLLDNRCIVEKVKELNNIPESIRPNGLLVWCLEDKKLYGYDEPNKTWEKVGTVVKINPTVDGNTEEMTSIQLDDDIYKIGIAEYTFNASGQQVLVSDYVKTIINNIGKGTILAKADHKFTLADGNNTLVIDTNTQCFGKIISETKYELYFNGGVDAAIINGVINCYREGGVLQLPGASATNDTTITLSHTLKAGSILLLSSGSGSSSTVEIEGGSTSSNSSVSVASLKFTYNNSPIMTEDSVHTLTLKDGSDTLCKFNAGTNNATVDLSKYMKGNLDSATGVLTITFG